MNLAKLRAVSVSAVVALAFVTIVSTAPTAEACEGAYPVGVAADTGQGLSYCSDGTIAGVYDLTGPTGEGDSRCGGDGDPAYVETEPVDTDHTNPTWICTDGTTGDVGLPAAGSGCGGNYLVTISANTGQGITYCSDGTFDGIRALIAPGDGESNCGGEYPVTVETQPVDTEHTNPTWYCSDGTFDALLP